MGVKHALFIARTVLVKTSAEDALKIVDRYCSKEGIFQQYRLTRRYEKPYMVRKRVNFQRCQALYNEEMNRKIQFFARKNRENPYPAS